MRSRMENNPEVKRYAGACLALLDELRPQPHAALQLLPCQRATCTLPISIISYASLTLNPVPTLPATKFCVAPSKSIINSPVVIQTAAH